MLVLLEREVFDWAFQRNLNRALIENLAPLDFVDRREDLLITGKSGTGKSHILQALALRACERELAPDRAPDLEFKTVGDIDDHRAPDRRASTVRAGWV